MEITGGEVSDYKGFDLMMRDPTALPRVLIADKGYDSDHVRDVVERAGGIAIIPARRTRKMPQPIDDYIYALRNRIERCFNKLKNSRRLATRYSKTAESYLGFVNLAAIRLWIRHFVNTT